MTTNKENVISLLQNAIDSIKKLPDNIELNITIEFTNTGIEEIQLFDGYPHDGYKGFIDLGGAFFSMELNIPNYKNRIYQINKELEK